MAEAYFEGEKDPGGVAGLALDCEGRNTGYHLVFEVINRCAEEVGALLGFDSKSEEVVRLSKLSPEQVFLRLNPIDLIKYGPSSMAAVFVGLVTLVTRRLVKKDIAITGELGLWYVVNALGDMYVVHACCPMFLWLMQFSSWDDRGRVYLVNWTRRC